jgi:DNA-binding NtrC family response regulator
VSPSNAIDPVALIVDDEPGIRQAASRFIEQWGFQVITARTGREAIEILQHRRIDIVMVDLRIPEVGGLAVLGAIRDSAPDCRAILMTGHTTEDTRLEAVKLGALDYLPKPLDWRYLEQRFASIREELERRQSILGAETELARRRRGPAPRIFRSGGTPFATTTSVSPPSAVTTSAASCARQEATRSTRPRGSA